MNSKLQKIKDCIVMQGSSFLRVLKDWNNFKNDRDHPAFVNIFKLSVAMTAKKKKKKSPQMRQSKEKGVVDGKGDAYTTCIDGTSNSLLHEFPSTLHDLSYRENLWTHH